EGQEGEEEAIEAEAEVQAEAESEEIIEIPEEEAASIEIEPEEEFEVITSDAEQESREVSVEIEPELEVEPEPQPPELEVLAPEPSYFDEGPELVVEQNSDAIKMAKDIIFEALEADDMIVAEIEQVSSAEIDTALEAISSDEAVPIGTESDETEAIDEESLLELETILGPLDRSVGGMGITSHHEEPDEESKNNTPINGETIAELERLLDTTEDNENDE
ncbi:MAG: hypothetical protein ACFFCP_13855, partial [Promethearchaeota archaeon]